MTADKRTSRYHVRGGSPEVVRLDAKRARSAPPTRPSEKRPIAHSTLEDKGAEKAALPPPPSPTISQAAPKRDARFEHRDPPPRERNSPRPETITIDAVATSVHVGDVDPRALEQLVAELVDDLIRSEPMGVGSLVPRVERLFDRLTPHYARRFPGPLWVDLRVPHADPPRGDSVSGMAACLVALGERSVPLVIELMRSPRSDQRFCAALVARELPFEPVTAALVDLALHDDPSSRLAAALVLPEISHARGHASAVETLRRIVRDSRETTLRVRAAQALEELRDAGAVPALVSLLGSGEPELVEAARCALRTITAHTHSRIGWWFWLRAHGNEPRFAWLRAAMEDGDAEHGAIAKRELVRLLGRTALDGGEEDVANSPVERRRNRRSWP